MKKLFCFLISVLMLVALFVPVLADAEPEDTPGDAELPAGTVIIENAKAGQTYSIYKIMDLVANDDYSSVVYKVAVGWEDFLGSEAVQEYISIDNNGVITWLKDQANDSDDIIAFSKLVKAEVENHEATRTLTATADGQASFGACDLGYYFLNNAIGNVFNLSTTASTIKFNVKTDVPSVDKVINEGDDEVKVNEAEIGDTVSFTTTINAFAGAKDYVLHDTMTDGLDFNEDITVQLKSGDVTSDVADSSYTVKTTGITDGCTFEIVFNNDAFLKNIKNGDQIIVKYTATLNENAVVAGDGNTNVTNLDYKVNDNVESTPDSTTRTYTWTIPVLKYTEVADGEEAVVETPLAGAEFVLYRLNGEAREYAVIENGKVVGYDSTVTEETATRVVTGANGKVSIDGFVTGTYYLAEVQAPAGYNLLTTPITVEVSTEAGAEANTLTQVVQQKDGDNWVRVNPDVKVLNNKGPVMPETGGIGTTIFYVVGAILVVAAGVLLVAKKRTASESAE